MLDNIKKIWIVEAVMLMLFSMMSVSFAIPSVKIILFPFQQLSDILRFLSLSSFVGNIGALLLYVLICSTPIIYLLRNFERTRIEKTILVILSVLLFVTLYLLINPVIMYNSFNYTMLGIEALDIVKLMLVGLVYTTLCGYLVIRVVNNSKSAGVNVLIKYINILMVFINIVLIYNVFGLNLNIAFVSLNKVMGNVFVEQLYIIVIFIKSSLPQLLVIGVIYKVVLLIKEMQIDRYSAKVSLLTRNLSHSCVNTLVIIILSNIILGIVLLLFIGGVSDLTIHTSMSVNSLLMVLSILLVSRLINENKDLKNENDRFI